MESDAASKVRVFTEKNWSADIPFVTSVEAKSTKESRRKERKEREKGGGRGGRERERQRQT